MSYPAVHQLIGRIARPHRGQLHRPHAPPHPRHRHGPPRRAGRGGRPAAHPPLVDDDQPDLCPPRGGRHQRCAVAGRFLARRRRAPSEPGCLPPRARRGSRSLPARRRPSTANGHLTTGTPAASGVPARRGRGAARFDTDHPGLAPRTGQALVPVPPGHRVRLHDHRRGALALTRFSRFLAELPRRRSTGPGAITRPVLEDYMAWLLGRGLLGRHPGAVAVDAPGVLRRLPPPRLAARARRRTPPSMSRNSPSTTTRSPASSPSS